jgi:hypothetical protein
MNDWNRVDKIFTQGLCDPDCEYLCTDYGHVGMSWYNCLLFDMTGTDPEFCPVYESYLLDGVYDDDEQ